MKKYIKILIMTSISYLLITLLIHYVGSWENFKSINLDQEITIELESHSGKEKKIKENKFDSINTKDRLIVNIPIPKDIDFDYPALCFTTFSSITKVWYKDQLLYSYGEELANQGKMIGTIYDSVIIPKESLGDTIILECIATEKGAMNQITNLILMEGIDSSKYPIADNLSTLIVFTSLFVISFFLFFILLIFYNKDNIFRISIWFTMVTAVVCLYILSSQGLLHPLIQDFRVIANIEYITIFFMPVSFGLFFYYVYENKILKRIIKSILIINLLFFIICTILNYTTANYHYVYFLPYLHLQIILAIVVYCIGFLIKNKKEEGKELLVPIRIGIIIFLIFAAIEVIKFYAARKSGGILFKLNLLPMGVILVIMTLVLGIILGVIKRFHEIEEKKQLEKLAFYDVLTGLETRTKCYSLIEKIKQENIWEYTIFFIDLNDLKYCNDKYGHHMGDEYLKSMARILKECFPESDSISRFGGDEFVILYLKNIEDRIEKLSQRFYEKMDEINKEKLYPFLVNAACGVVSSTKTNPLEIESAISIADQRMYINKKKMKKKE